jgi:hypothetical protein
VAALRDAGFDDADAWPRAGSVAQAIGQHVIVAHVAVEAGTVADAASLQAQEPALASATANTATDEQADALRAGILDALPADRHELLREYVRGCVIRVLKLDPADPPASSDRLMDLGFDSLMAVQLRNQLGIGLKLDKPLPATVMFDQPTISALASYLLDRLTSQSAVEPSWKAEAKTAPSTLDAVAVAAMSDAEIEALLESRLEQR